MDDLKAVSTRRINVKSSPSSQIRIIDHKSLVNALKNQPNLETFEAALKYITNDRQLNIKIPSPQATPIIQVLVEDVLPNYWHQIITDSALETIRKHITKCLQSLPALGAFLARLKALNKTQERGSYSQTHAVDFETHAVFLLEVLEQIADQQLALHISEDIKQYDAPEVQKTLIWKEFVNVVAGGRMLSCVGETQINLNKCGEEKYDFWLADGNKYARWLASMVFVIPPEQGAMIISKGLSLGYSDVLLRRLLECRDIEVLVTVLTKLKAFEIKNIFQLLIRLIAAKRPQVADIPRLIKFLYELGSRLPPVKEAIIDSMLSPQMLQVHATTVLTRSLFKSLVLLDEGKGEEVLDNQFELFADDLTIRHTPVVQQEVNTQILLIAAGHVHRKALMSLKIRAMGHYLNGVSKHLDSTSPRVRWLGMVVGTAISSLVDTETIFKDMLQDAEAKDFLDLTTLSDTMAEELDWDILLGKASVKLAVRNKPSPKTTTSAVESVTKMQPQKSKIVVLDEEDADLVPYPKPDSDPEDEDEDATLVNRDKARAPVYIRDLLLGLQETEKYDRLEIALRTAASLIRRKTGFGMEVSEHAEALATTLMNMSNTFELDDFSELQHEALIATILADPAVMARFVVAYLFDGDLSLQQRISILTALGLAGRELAGYKDTKRKSERAFPSKRLPPHLEAVYSDSRLQSVASSIEQATLQPRALEAADKITGPNVLKVRTFSSRMAVEQRKKKTTTPNALAQIVADSFFFPLTSRWWIARAAPHSVWKKGLVLPTYLRTLGVLLHSAGPFALALPQLTREGWDVFMCVRYGLDEKDWGIVEAALFGILMLLQLNDKEALAREWAREVVESMEWAKLVMQVTSQSTGDGGESDEEKVRRVAAGVIVMSGEIVEKWRSQFGGLI